VVRSRTAPDPTAAHPSNLCYTAPCPAGGAPGRGTTPPRHDPTPTRAAP